jgi:hypothetical protein
MASKIRWMPLRKHGKQLTPTSKHTFETVTSQEVIRPRKERNVMYLEVAANNEDVSPPESKVVKIKSRNARRK